MVAGHLSGAARHGSVLVNLPSGALVRIGTMPRAVLSLLSMRGRQRAQAPRRRAWICRSARSTTTPRRARGFAPLAKLRTSPGGGSDGARRASAKPLARACEPAKDIAVRATCTRRPFKIDRATLPGTAAGAHPGLSRGRGRDAGSTERLRWCGSPADAQGRCRGPARVAARACLRVCARYRICL